MFKANQLQIFYGVLAVCFVAWLSKTLYQQPLFPIQTDNKDWLAAWLVTTICDYYVLAFCLSTIVLSSEPLLPAILWVLAINLLGSAFFAIYLLVRVSTKGTVALASEEASSAEPLLKRN